MKSVFSVLLVLAFSLAILHCRRQANAQDPSAAAKAPDNPNTVVIQFKVFDANDPKIEFHPDLTRRPIIFLRNLETKVDQVFLGNAETDAEIKESKDRKGFYEITLPKGRLINELSIDVRELNTNFAAITKVVTANNIVLYPGASKSLEDFTFTAFEAQIARYKSLMTQLTDQFYDRSEEIRGVLITRYATNLKNMQWGLDNGKVSFTRPEQQTAARKSLNEVLALYRIQPTVPTAEKEQTVVYKCYRCKIFGRRHR